MEFEFQNFSTYVAKSVERLTSIHDVESSSLPPDIYHIRYVLLIDSPNNLNLLSWLLIIYNK